MEGRRIAALALAAIRSGWFPRRIAAQALEHRGDEPAGFWRRDELARVLILQPIDDAGIALLRDAGHEVVSGEGDGRPVEAIVTRDARVDAARMDASPELVVIGSHGTGVNAIDVDAATARGIFVVNTPGANARPVAEHATALMLAVARQVLASDHAARAGDDRFRFANRFRDLGGAVLGLVGYGHTARALARIARDGLGMAVRVWSRSLAPGPLTETATAVGSLDELIAQSDVVSLHLPASAQTLGLIGRDRLTRFRGNCILINTARGSLIDETALVDALDAGRLFGAGLDVLAAEEGLPGEPRLLAHPRVVLTPHIAGSTPAGLVAMASMVCSQVVGALAGRAPPHLVNRVALAARGTSGLDQVELPCGST